MVLLFKNRAFFKRFVLKVISKYCPLSRDDRPRFCLTKKTELLLLCSATFAFTLINTKYSSYIFFFCHQKQNEKIAQIIS